MCIMHEVCTYCLGLYCTCILEDSCASVVHGLALNKLSLYELQLCSLLLLLPLVLGYARHVVVWCNCPTQASGLVHAELAVVVLFDVRCRVHELGIPVGAQLCHLVLRCEVLEMLPSAVGHNLRKSLKTSTFVAVSTAEFVPDLHRSIHSGVHLDALACLHHIGDHARMGMFPFLALISEQPFAHSTRRRLGHLYSKHHRITLMQHLAYFDHTIIVQLLQGLILVLLRLPHCICVFSSTYSTV